MIDISICQILVVFFLWKKLALELLVSSLGDSYMMLGSLKFLNTGTDSFSQTGQTQTRLLIKEQSHQDLHLPFHLHLLNIHVLLHCVKLTVPISDSHNNYFNCPSFQNFYSN